MNANVCLVVIQCAEGLINADIMALCVVPCNDCVDVYYRLHMHMSAV